MAVKKLLRKLKRKVLGLPKSKVAPIKVVIPEDTPYDRESFDSFSELLEYSANAKTASEARHAVHCLFQGVYDLLYNYQIASVNELYIRIVRMGIKFYTAFYQGELELNTLHNLLPSLEPLKEYDNKYRYKSRGNFPNLVDASNVGEYLQEVINSGYTFDTIVGIACSASEPAMALAGLLGLDLQFIRYSKRRGDDEVTTLDFMTEQVKSAIKGNRVLVIDDCVQYGVSMEHAMEYINEQGASLTLGSCIYNNNPNRLDEIISKPNFHLYE